MNNGQAYKRAMAAIDKIDDIPTESGNHVFMDLASGEIMRMIGEFLAYEFKQGPKPDDYPSQGQDGP